MALSTSRLCALSLVPGMGDTTMTGWPQSRRRPLIHRWTSQPSILGILRSTSTTPGRSSSRNPEPHVGANGRSFGVPVLQDQLHQVDCPQLVLDAYSRLRPAPAGLESEDLLERRQELVAAPPFAQRGAGTGLRGCLRSGLW
jgi:hypothetical protein